VKKFLYILLTFCYISFGFSQEKSLKIGDIAPTITLPTIDGKSFDFNSLKGKVVLIDFWASWCGPCVKEQPELVALYDSLSKEVMKGDFEILGVSLDKKQENWEAVVNRYKIPWTQVGDLKFWRSQVAVDYHLEEIPFNVIMGPDGKIIAMNLHGEELYHFLQKVLSE